MVIYITVFNLFSSVPCWINSCHSIFLMHILLSGFGDLEYLFLLPVHVHTEIFPLMKHKMKSLVDVDDSGTL